MALQKFQIGYRIQDAQFVTTSEPFYGQTDDTTTLADVITAVQALGTDLNGVTDGEIVFVEYKLIVPLLSAWSTGKPVSPGANVEDTGLFNFAIAGQVNRSFSFDVPAFKRSLVTGGHINLAAGPVTTFLGDIPSGIANLDLQTEVYQDLGIFRKCRLSTRKHRKPETLASTED